MLPPLYYPHAYPSFLLYCTVVPGRTTFIIDKGVIQDVHDSVINFAYVSLLIPISKHSSFSSYYFARSAHEKFVTKWLEKRAGAKPSEPGAATTTTTEAEAAAENPVEAVAPTDAALPPSALAADAAAPA